MNRKPLLILALLALLFTGCSSARYVSKTPASVAQPIALLEPMSEIFFVEKNGTETLDIGLSETSTQILSEALTSLPLPVEQPGGYPVAEVIPVDYSGDDNPYAWHVSALAGVRPKALKNAGVPDEITRLLRSYGYRYGMLVYHTGFTRDRSNYAKSVARDVGLSIVTGVIAGLLGGGAVYTGHHLRHLSRIFIMIVDVEANEIVYFASTANMEEERNPLNAPLQKERVLRLLRRFK